MPKTRVYLEDGVYRGSLSGNRIREFKDKLHRVVSADQDRAAREAFKAARDARIPRGPGARGGVVVPGRVKGIRELALRQYNEHRAADPHDGPADQNTVRMMLKLHAADDGTHLRVFRAHANNIGAHYWKYNPVSHGFEMYTHRQVYLGTYQLPVTLRSKKTVGPIQHYPRTRAPKSNKGGPTTVYTSIGYRARNPENALIQVALPTRRPPGGGRHY